MRTNNFYLEIKKGDQVLTRKQSSEATCHIQAIELEKKIKDKELSVFIMVSSEKEKVFNHLDY